MPKQKNVQIGASVTPEIKQRLEAHARKVKRSSSQIIALSLDETLPKAKGGS